MRLRHGALALAALLSTPSWGARELLYVDMTPVPSAVAGALSPLALSVDGKLLVRQPRAFAEVEVNGQRLQVQDDARRAFFGQSDRDKIVVVVRTWNQIEESLVVDMPCVQGARVNGPQILFKLCPGIDRVRVNGKAVAVKGDTATWSPPSMTPNKLYTLELVGTAQLPGRLYNFRILRGREAVAAARKKGHTRSPASASWGIIPIDDPKPELQLLRAHAGLSAILAPGSTGLGVEAAWAPSYFIDEQWRVRAHLGAIVGSFAGGFKAGLLGEAIGSYRFTPSLDAELGVGAQSWSGMGTRPTVALQLGVPVKWGDWVDRLSVGYTAILASPLVHAVRVSVGIWY